VTEEVENCIRAFSDQQDCYVIELNIQAVHVHLLALVPPKVSISEVGTLKGGTAIKKFSTNFANSKENPILVIYSGPEDIVLIRSAWMQEMIRKFVRVESINEPSIMD
jgi:REP element-mobilizing transposase RayT